MTEIRFEDADAVGRITLDAPQRINALTRGMIDALHEQFSAWRDDPRVARIELRGHGPHGFCAGADIKTLRTQLIEGDAAAFHGFLAAEYTLDELIATFPKPVTAHLVGVSMGGGLGIGLHTSRRIGVATTRFAMPETAIGLWPDVGVCWELARTPGRVGEYLAMTGNTIDGASARWAGLLDECEDVDPATSSLACSATWIDECFAADDAVGIVSALRAHGHPQARQAADVIETRCPMSVAVALEAVRNARHMATVGEVLAQDLRLAAAVTANPQDFIEGVRAKMVDKDNAPRWRHASLAEVDPDEVATWLG